MPRVQSVSICVARVPLDHVTSFATRTVSRRDYYPGDYFYSSSVESSIGRVLSAFGQKPTH